MDGHPPGNRGQNPAYRSTRRRYLVGNHKIAIYLGF